LTNKFDRLSFLRRAAALGLAAPTLSTFGCSLEEIRREDEGASFSRSVTRPILLPWTDDSVRIAAPLSAVPIAYVSRGLMRIYIGLEHRIRVRVMLAAHISVSTAHWRIPLPGDDLAIPVDAGDALREFVETPLGDWDPTLDPTEGDFRIRLGQRENVEVAFNCLPMAARDGWFSGGPWEIEQCMGRGSELCREGLVRIGTGSRYAGRPLGSCAESVNTVEYVTWACPNL